MQPRRQSQHGQDCRVSLGEIYDEVDFSSAEDAIDRLAFICGPRLLP